MKTAFVFTTMVLITAASARDTIEECVRAMAIDSTSIYIYPLLFFVTVFTPSCEEFS